MAERRKQFPFDEFEPKWQNHWEENKTFSVPNPGDDGFDPAKPKYYVLDMFPFETGDAEAAQTWAPTVVDTNGNGQLDAWTNPGEPQDPALDMRFRNGFYAVMPEPRGDAVWGSNAFRYPGSITRMMPGDDPPNTTLSEVYYPPLPGFGVRGADIDKNGVVWTSLGSGHLGEFDRRKCNGPLNGPTATGNHCPEGSSSSCSA